MKIFIITPFPDLINQFMESTMIKKAQNKELLKYETLNLFDYTDHPHRNIDDYPFGGGEGMVMKPEPIFRAFDNINSKNNLINHRVIYPTPDGKKFNQNEANMLKNHESLIFICGHYKGIDQRVRDKIVTDEISIGDYILTGGDLPACIITDSIVRLIPGVLGNSDSLLDETFERNLLEYPQYTKPKKWENKDVPEVLLSGDHAKIKGWRLDQSKDITRRRRPDLWEKYKKKK